MKLLVRFNKWLDEFMQPPKCNTSNCRENIDGYCCTVLTSPSKCSMVNKPNNKLFIKHGI